MSMKNYVMGKIGEGLILLSPAETAARVIKDSRYTGMEQVDEGMAGLTAGLAAWNYAKWDQENENDRKRSPLVHLGRTMEIGGAGGTAYNLQTGNVDNVFRAFGPAAIGIPAGAFLEYVAGPVHERFSKRYETEMENEGE